MPLMSQREYAKHRGCSHVAVGKAVKDGRIAAAVVDGKIDPARADQLWALNTDPSHRPQANSAPAPKAREGQAQAAPVTTTTSPGAVPTLPRPKADPKSTREAPKNDRPPAAEERLEPISGVELPDLQPGMTYMEAKAAREAYLAHLAKLDYETKSGQLVEVEKVRVQAFNAARRARDMMLGVPDRLAPILAGEQNAFEVHRMLTEALREICNMIALPEHAGV